MITLVVVILCVLVVRIPPNLAADDDVNYYFAAGVDTKHANDIAFVVNYLNTTSVVNHYDYTSVIVTNAVKQENTTKITLELYFTSLKENAGCERGVQLCEANLFTMDEDERILQDIHCNVNCEADNQENTDVSHSGAPNEVPVINETFEGPDAVQVEQPIPKQHQNCLGCPVELHASAEGVDRLVEIALEHIESDSNYKLLLKRVIRVLRQIESSVLYTLVLEVRPLNNNRSPSAVCEIHFQQELSSKSIRIFKNNCTVSQEFPPTNTNEVITSDMSISSTPSANDNNERVNNEFEYEDLTADRLADLLSQIEPSFSAEESDNTVPMQSIKTPQSKQHPDANDFEENAQLEPVVFKSHDGKIEHLASKQMYKRYKRSTDPMGNVNESNNTKVDKFIKNTARKLCSNKGRRNNHNSSNIKLVYITTKPKHHHPDSVTVYNVTFQCLVSKRHSQLLYSASQNHQTDVKITECTAQFKFDKANNKSTLETHKCNKRKILKGKTHRKRSLKPVGAPLEIDKDDPKVRRFVDEALTHLDSQSSHTTKHRADILSVKKQIVSGVLYTVQISLSSNCVKSNSAEQHSTCNQLLQDGHSNNICTVTVWEQVWKDYQNTTVECDDGRVYNVEEHHKNVPMAAQRRKRRKRQLPPPADEIQLELNDPMIQPLLSESLSQVDANSDDFQHRLKVLEVQSASSSKQTALDTVWSITAKIGESDCPKDTAAALEDCNALEASDPKLCRFRIWQGALLPLSSEVNITCDDGAAYSFRDKRSIVDEHGTFTITATGGNYRRYNTIGDDVEFVEFKEMYNKSYKDAEEELYRKTVYTNNLRRIKELQQHELGTGEYGATEFADLTADEFSKLHGYRADLRPTDATTAFPSFNVTYAEIPDIPLPAEFDWREHNAVTAVKNQGFCGSCWAFSTTGNVEGQAAIKHDVLVELSEQELVDCDKVDNGCMGGEMYNAYVAIERLGGLETEHDYPYRGFGGRHCHFNKTPSLVKVVSALNISQDEDEMAKWLVANGPISIAINANVMQFYMGGVSHPPRFLCSHKGLDHGVLLVGYGVTTSKRFSKKKVPFWIVKNSWGPSWGIKGYYLVYRGDGTCGLNQQPSSAVVA